MKKPLDRFSTQAESYKKYRPTYPSNLYDEIFEHVSFFDTCWDCATGNGQVATVLASKFKKVFATDISENQLVQAQPISNVKYSVQLAEKTNFPDHHFDLITVGQAIHWFDFEAFNMEVKRVLKPNGVIAFWGYGLIKVDDPIDAITSVFDSEIVGPYWDVERRHIDHAYSTIPFDFEPIECKDAYFIQEEWDLNRLEGYFNSWSCVQNFIKKNNQNPVPDLMKRISSYWKEEEIKKVRFPIFLRMGRAE